jgi:hypothetical protein
VLIDLTQEEGETDEQVLVRARKLADESACPILIDGRIMVWADGYTLDTTKTGASKDPRFTEFRAYARDKAANGESVS